jgi:hypothetical protein
MNTPIVKGTAGSGIFSIAMLNARQGVIVGGNYEKPNEINNNLAFTTDRGASWTLGKGLSGYRSGVTYIDKNTLMPSAQAVLIYQPTAEKAGRISTGKIITRCRQKAGKRFGRLAQTGLVARYSFK